MGRTTSWLAEQRPAMIEILAEMERNSPYAGGDEAHGDLGMLLMQLSRVAAGTGGRPRSLQAMRQAWWRWTTHGPHAATPPMQDLALMVRHAKNHGWLQQLKQPDCLSLVSRLMEELNKKRASQYRLREVAWGPTVRIAVEGFADFLEARISQHADGDGEAVIFPDPMMVQEEVETMLTEVIERVLISLDTPRELFKDPHDTDSFLRPFEGWPDAFRKLASNMSDILNSAAKEYENFEASYFPSPADSSNCPRRINLFGARPIEPEEE